MDIIMNQEQKFTKEELCSEAIRSFYMRYIGGGTSYYLTLFTILSSPELHDIFKVNSLDELKSLEISPEKKEQIEEYIDETKSVFNRKAEIVVEILLLGKEDKYMGNGWVVLAISNNKDLVEKILSIKEVTLNDLLTETDKIKAKDELMIMLGLSQKQLQELVSKAQHMWCN